MDQLFETLHCPEKWRVDFVVFHLKGQANLWWKTAKEKKNEPNFDWEKRQQVIREVRYPPSLQRQNESEFLHLQQGKMTVLEYASKFLELARFAPNMVATKQMKIDRF